MNHPTPRPTPSPTPTVQILGAGCPRCRALASRTEQALASLGIDTAVEKIDDPWAIAEHGVMSIPALVIGGEVVLSGNVPDFQQLCTLIQGAITP